MANKTFTATLITEEKKGAWTYIVWPDSAAFFGTRKPVKVTGTIDGHTFQATFLPLGDGTHMLPVKAATLKTVGKKSGETVEISLDEKP